MTKADLLPWIGTFGAVCIGVLLALAGSDGGGLAFGVPTFALCVALAYILQWVSFVPAYLKQTERFFDLIGAATFALVACVALVGAGEFGVRAVAIALMVVVWAARLGVFLGVRVHRSGGDRRFDTIKINLGMFLMTWTLQAVWVCVSFGPGLVAITTSGQGAADAYLLAGAALWGVGLMVEVVADEQKRRFRSTPGNARRFIDSGLWAWSRHPNYFGEIVLWLGIAVAAFPALGGWQYATLVSPVFVWLLLTRISGVRMLEAAAAKRWAGDDEYTSYLARTPVLLPRPPRRP